MDFPASPHIVADEYKTNKGDGAVPPRPPAWGKLDSNKPSACPSFDLFKHEVVVGRGKECECRLPQSIRTISNKHCTISLWIAEDGVLSPYIVDSSSNGTFIDGKQIPKGQKVMLIDGAIVSLVFPRPGCDSTCISFKFVSLLSSLSKDYSTLLCQEINKCSNVAQRTNQFESFQVRNIKKPEQFIHILKIEPTVANLTSLNETMRWCVMRNSQWLETFIGLGGINGVIEVVSANNRLARADADAAVDFECLKIIETLVSYAEGIAALINHTDALDEVVLTLVNPSHTAREKSFVLNFFCTICESSEHGYSVVVKALDRLKVVKREKTRFQFLAQSLITEQDVEYKIKCMRLANCILAGNKASCAKHKQDFLNLGFLRIVEVLYHEHNLLLDEQLDTFSKYMDLDDMWYRTVNFEDPVSLCVAAHDQIKRDKKACALFSACLRRILAICTADRSTAKIDYDIVKSLDMIEKTAHLFADLALDSFAGNTDEYKRTIDAIVQEYQAIIHAICPPPPPPEVENKTNTPPPPPPDSSSAIAVIVPPLHLSALIEPASMADAPPPSSPSAPASGDFVASPPPPPPPSGKPPPPMPGKKGAPPATTKRNTEVPKVPMRQLYWTKVPPAKIRNTVWDIDHSSATLANVLKRLSVELPALVSDSNSKKVDVPRVKPVPLNKDDLEKMFCAKKTSSRGSTNGRDMNGKDEELLDKAKEVTLLDMRRSNNLGIVISRFKMTADTVQEDLLSLDETKLTKEKVNVLLKCVPTPDEEGILVSYKGDAPLAPVEHFLLAMLNIPRLNERLECLQFKLQFEATIDELRNSASTVEHACEALSSDSAFRQILLVVLKVGNYMNGGSARGEAVGFKINSLLNLSDIKSVDNKSTLLHYVCQYIQEQYPDVIGRCEEMFKLAEAASRIVWKDLLAQLEAVKTGMMKIVNELPHFESPRLLPNDHFWKVMNQFVLSKTPILDGLCDQIKAIDLKFTKTAAYYGEDGVAPEDFFSLLHDFNTLLTKAVKDIEREREAAKRADMLAERRKEATSKRHSGIFECEQGGHRRTSSLSMSTSCNSINDGRRNSTNAFAGFRSSSSCGSITVDNNSVDSNGRSSRSGSNSNSCDVVVSGDTTTTTNITPVNNINNVPTNNNDGINNTNHFLMLGVKHQQQDESVDSSNSWTKNSRLRLVISEQRKSKAPTI